MLNKCIKLIGALTSKPYAFSARSWELEKLDFLDFYDGMLSNISIDIRGLSIMRILPRISENFNEEWISDKIRFSYDGFRRQRIVTPLFKDSNSGVFYELSWEESFFNFFFNYNLLYYDYINNLDEGEVVYGKFLDLESLIISKDFFNSFSNIKMNLKYQDHANFLNFQNSDYLLNFDLSKLSSMDYGLIIGSNVRFENPLIHLKLLRLANQGVPMFTFASSSSLKFKNYSFGNNIKILLNFFRGKNKYSLLFSKSKQPLVLLGESLKQRIDSYALIRLFQAIANKKFKISHIYNNASKIGGLALGIYEKSDKSFFNYKNSQLLFLYNADDVVVDKKKYNFIVYQGHHGDYGASISNLIFPSAFLLEKKGTFINMSGSFINYNFVIKPGLNVRTDWRIFKALNFFFNKRFTYLYNTFSDLSLSILNYLPTFYRMNKIQNFNLSFSFFKEFSLLFYNVVSYSFYIEYFLSDNVSRASRVMSISATKFRNYFFNF
jgi:NADH dehydrogenase/NADH:ubiquinone oxidoreductase subunit G